MIKKYMGKNVKKYIYISAINGNRFFCYIHAHIHRKLHVWWTHLISNSVVNKANLRELIAATGLVILLKFDPNHRLFSPFDLESWCMTSKNDRAPLLYYIKLCVSFQIHRWIQTEVTLRKLSIRVKIGDFLSLVTLKFDGWPWKTIWHKW